MTKKELVFILKNGYLLYFSWSMFRPLLSIRLRLII